MENIQNIGIEKDGDIIFVTMAKFKLFMAYGKIGMDAYCLYSHMMFTARLQETNQIYANDTYLRTGLDWSKERLQKAKNLLIELNLIDEIFNRDENGRFIGKYIKVKTTSTPFEISSVKQPSDGIPPDGFTAGGELETNALTKKINALTRNIKRRQFSPPAIQEIEEYVKANNYKVDSQTFYEFFTENNWRDSNNKPVNNWKQKVITWDSYNYKLRDPVKKSYEEEMNERYGK